MSSAVEAAPRMSVEPPEDRVQGMVRSLQVWRHDEFKSLRLGVKSRVRSI
jgi:hypothetical protein